MLTNVDLSREVAKVEYKRLKGDADLKLAGLQRQVKALGIPVIIVFEGWSAVRQRHSDKSIDSTSRSAGIQCLQRKRANGRGEVLSIPVAVLEKDTDAGAVSHFRSELESPGGD